MPPLTRKPFKFAEKRALCKPPNPSTALLRPTWKLGVSRLSSSQRTSWWQSRSRRWCRGGSWGRHVQAEAVRNEVGS